MDKFAKTLTDDAVEKSTVNTLWNSFKDAAIIKSVEKIYTQVDVQK